MECLRFFSKVNGLLFTVTVSFFCQRSDRIPTEEGAGTCNEAMSRLQNHPPASGVIFLLRIRRNRNICRKTEKSDFRFIILQKIGESARIWESTVERGVCLE